LPPQLLLVLVLLVLLRLRLLLRLCVVDPAPDRAGSARSRWRLLL
jgi:hypothetical protein